jgi:hypothetical protein
MAADRQILLGRNKSAERIITGALDPLHDGTEACTSGRRSGAPADEPGAKINYERSRTRYISDVTIFDRRVIVP